jgi:hypothetical protein
MTPVERQMLANLFERVNASGATSRDAQAEAFINDAVRALPFAPYVLAQTVLVQQQALEAAAHRVAELEAAARQGAEPQQQGSFLGNLGKSLFGGGAPSAPPRPSYDAAAGQRGPAPAPGQAYAPPPPAPQTYAAPPPSGPWGAPSGGGFLQNAASTAAGVAGGVALGNLLGGLFGGHSGSGLFGGGLGGAGLGGGFPGGSETVNIFEAPHEGRDSSDVHDAGNFEPGAPDDAGYLDDSSFDDGSGDDGSGGGYDDV